MPLVTTTLGDRLFLPYQMRAPMTERLSWYTYVGQAFDRTEQRMSLHQQGRQSFAGVIPLNVQEAFTTSFNLLFDNLGESNWTMPHWGEVKAIESVDVDLQQVFFDTSFVDLRVGGLAVLWGTACAGGWQIVTVSAIEADHIVIEEEPAVTSGLVLPLRTGRLSTPLKRAVRGLQGDLVVEFDVDDLQELTSDEPEQFLGEDIYFDEVMFPTDDAELNEDFIDGIDQVDDEIGVVAQFDHWDGFAIRRPHSVMLDNLEDIWNFRLWLHRRQGRYKAYWRPSFYNDVRVKDTGPVTTLLTVWPDDRMLGATARTHVAIQKRDGTWLARTVTDTEVVDENNLVLTLDTSLAMDGDDIVRVSYLGLYRLDTDTVDLEWSGGVVSSTFNVLEIAP